MAARTSNHPGTKEGRRAFGTQRMGRGRAPLGARKSWASVLRSHSFRTAPGPRSQHECSRALWW
eukprot:scaffold24636_cov31-Tisochrysis_lutea.AAC.7